MSRTSADFMSYVGSLLPNKSKQDDGNLYENEDDDETGTAMSEEDLSHYEHFDEYGYSLNPNLHEELGLSVTRESHSKRKRKKKKKHRGKSLLGSYSTKGGFAGSSPKTNSGKSKHGTKEKEPTIDNVNHLRQVDPVSLEELSAARVFDRQGKDFDEETFSMFLMKRKLMYSDTYYKTRYYTHQDQPSIQNLMHYIRDIEKVEGQQLKLDNSVLMGKIHSTAYCAYGSWCCGLCTGCVSMCLGLYYTQAYMKEAINYDSLQERRKRMNEAYMAHLYDEKILTDNYLPLLENEDVRESLNASPSNIDSKWSTKANMSVSSTSSETMKEREESFVNADEGEHSVEMIRYDQNHQKKTLNPMYEAGRGSQGGKTGGYENNDNDDGEYNQGVPSPEDSLPAPVNISQAKRTSILLQETGEKGEARPGGRRVSSVSFGTEKGVKKALPPPSSFDPKS